jgi:hypothetical protein
MPSGGARRVAERGGQPDKDQQEQDEGHEEERCGGKRGLEGAARQIVQRARNGRAPAANRPKYALAAGHDARKNPGAVRSRQSFALLDRRAMVG